MAAVIGNSRNVTGCRMAADERPTIGATKTTRMTAGYVDPATVDVAPRLPGKRALARMAAAEEKAEHNRRRNRKRAERRARRKAAA